MMYLILGLGKSGLAACRYCQERHIPYRRVDKQASDGVLSDQQPPNLDGITHVIKSPGIPLEHPWLVKAQGLQLPILTEIDLALPLLTHKTILAVTGSNGKTTTVMATQQVLWDRAICVGNIGMPLLEAIDHPAPILVAELSSFQLETLQPGPWFDAAVILNISANHLDYHQTMDRYIAAKNRIKLGLKPNGRFLSQKDFLSLQEKIETFFEEDYRKGARKLYAHDKANFAAVYALCQGCGVSDEAFKRAIVGVKKPPHRLEHVGYFGGVEVINDSKSTSVDATIKAVSALCKPIVLIAGGVDKGGAFSDWIAPFKNKVKAIITLGAASLRMQQELSSAFNINHTGSLSEAIDLAKKNLIHGDILLLSPGCASYDQFRNYEERGELFRQLVHVKLNEG
jgi:UDP-N-acetylmuramoylalanine--D-glutamate ligase